MHSMRNLHVTDSEARSMCLDTQVIFFVALPMSGRGPDKPHMRRCPGMATSSPRGEAGAEQLPLARWGA